VEDMSVVWIVTTGNSDVKLTQENSWGSLRLKKLDDLEPCPDDFSPKEESNSDLFTLPARVTGIVYGDAIATHSHILKFPLLNGFCNKLEHPDDENNFPPIKPDRIFILLTDQENIFEKGDRSDSDSAYWKDTITLQPIFEYYFQKQFDIKIEPVYLRPKSGSKGLDDWDVTLKLVQTEFDKLGITQDDEVIVSHQAGTPAISSAVQFVSLLKFQGKVSFLLSNERSEEVNLISYSSYFQSMQIEEAKKLLANYNYVGVESVLKTRLQADDRDVAKNILALLEVAKLWNLSKFSELKDKLQKLPLSKLRDLATERVKQWWWSAYEEAYLAVVRKEQENFVEALFHSFRSVEGLFSEWGKDTFFDHIEVDPISDRPFLNPTILQNPKGYFSKAKYKQDGKPKDNLADLKSELELRQEKLNKQEEVKNILLYGKYLYTLFGVVRDEYRDKCTDLKRFWADDGISEKRNRIFHQLQGVSKEQLSEFWEVSTISDWECKMVRFLNFISQQEFKSLEEVSLMARVHDELVKAIESFEA
jgi:hypothetical protein